MSYTIPDLVVAIKSIEVETEKGHILLIRHGQVMWTTTTPKGYEKFPQDLQVVFTGPHALKLAVDKYNEVFKPK